MGGEAGGEVEFAGEVGDLGAAMRLYVRGNSVQVLLHAGAAALNAFSGDFSLVFA